jgi:hypothetical protein
MTAIGAVLDLAQDAHPILLEGVVALDDRLQLEAFGRIADLRAPKDVDSAVDVLLCDTGWDLFDPHEVLLVERAQALDLHLQFIDGNVQFRDFHEATLGA